MDNRFCKSTKMKPIFIIIAVIILITSCSYERDKQLAEHYKLDLQYYQNSVSFASLNMMDQAYMSCTKTEILKSECFTSLVQSMLSKNINPAKEFCDEINPQEKMYMTKKAFTYVYPVIDEDLEEELNEKLNPSSQRIETLNIIKEQCYEKAGS